MPVLRVSALAFQNALLPEACGLKTRLRRSLPTSVRESQSISELTSLRHCITLRKGPPMKSCLGNWDLPLALLQHQVCSRVEFEFHLPITPRLAKLRCFRLECGKQHTAAP